MGLVELESYARPRVLPIHAFAGDECVISSASAAANTSTDSAANAGELLLPAEVGLSIEHISPEGVYLVDNGIDFILRIGRAVNPAILNDLFGMTDVSAYPGKVLRLRAPPAEDTRSHAARLRALIDYLRRLSPYYQEVRPKFHKSRI